MEDADEPQREVFTPPMVVSDYHAPIRNSRSASREARRNAAKQSAEKWQKGRNFNKLAGGLPPRPTGGAMQL